MISTELRHRGIHQFRLTTRFTSLGAKSSGSTQAGISSTSSPPAESRTALEVPGWCGTKYGWFATGGVMVICGMVPTWSRNDRGFRQWECWQLVVVGVAVRTTRRALATEFGDSNLSFCRPIKRPCQELPSANPSCLGSNLI